MGVYEVKQAIVIRQDLNMPKGKMASQVAHASMGALLNYATRGHHAYFGSNGDTGYVHYEMRIPFPVDQWLTGAFAKVVLKAPSIDELLELEQKAKELNLPYKTIIDNGTTVFDGEKTLTCVAVGPWTSDVIESLTKQFKLL